MLLAYWLTPLYWIYFVFAFREVKAMKEACGLAHMKSILAIGELGSMENVYKV